MKTTLEVPDELYLEVKSQAALRRKKIKDYVAEGLRLALAADRNREFVDEGPLAVFEEVRQSPLHSQAEVTDWIEQTNVERKARWRDED
jgi:hypothetical protein